MRRFKGPMRVINRKEAVYNPRHAECLLLLDPPGLLPPEDGGQNGFPLFGDEQPQSSCVSEELLRAAEGEVPQDLR